MALEAAQKGAGRKIIDNLGDDQFKGMEKWEYKVKSADGLDSVVHYVRDPKTGKLMDFKFKKHSTDAPGIWGITPEPSVPPYGN
jgi:filamentous hemagglutinin